jgi:hypothetical protein
MLFFALDHFGSASMYQREISRQNKALFVFLLDQSFSMEEPFGGTQQRKKDGVVAAINGWLQAMAARATGSEGIRDWFDIAVMGYRTDQQANPIIESALVGPLRDKLSREGGIVASIVDIGNAPARMEARSKKIFVEETGEFESMEVTVPVWVDPVAEGGTPMCNALYKTYELINGWVADHKSSFPPIVIHITDGESQDGDPIAYAESVRGLATDDGNVLVFNCHISMDRSDPFLFPHTDEILPDPLARVLFRMSSPLPEPVYQRALTEGFELQPGARGMTFNAEMVSFIKFLDIGTRISTNLR